MSQTKQKAIRPKILHEAKASKKVSDIRKKCRKNFQQDKFYLFKFDELFSEINNGIDSISIPFMDQLETSDWKSLNNNEWLTNFILDACLLVIIKESKKIDCYCIPCQCDNIQLDQLNIFMKNKPELLFIPIINSNHFTLCVLKFSTHEFIYINSFSSDGVGKNIYNYFIANIGSNATLWQYKEIENRVLQVDVSSCGIIVLMYAERILKDEPLTNLCNPNSFRKQMKNLLLKHQGDKTRFCCHCGCAKNINCKITICDSCKYYICPNCNYKH